MHEDDYYDLVRDFSQFINEGVDADEHRVLIDALPVIITLCESPSLSADVVKNANSLRRAIQFRLDDMGMGAV
jgi:hypothetical protein